MRWVGPRTRAEYRHLGDTLTAFSSRLIGQSTHLPSPGIVTNHHPPGGLGVRVETALYDGYRVPVHYDPLIAKVIAHAEERGAAIRRAKAALREYLVDGIKTNIPLHLQILDDPQFVAGQFSTNFLQRFEPRLEIVAEQHAKAS